jgi:hypothetical protein
MARATDVLSVLLKNLEADSSRISVPAGQIPINVDVICKKPAGLEPVTEIRVCSFGNTVLVASLTQFTQLLLQVYVASLTQFIQLLKHNSYSFSKQIDTASLTQFTQLV